MKRKINQGYLASILLTVFVYWLPLDFANSILHWILALILAALYIYALRIIFQSSPKNARVSVALWITNSLALLHLTLIYIALGFSGTATILIGGLFGALLYYLVTRQVDQKLN